MTEKQKWRRLCPPLHGIVKANLKQSNDIDKLLPVRLGDILLLSYEHEGSGWYYGRNLSSNTPAGGGLVHKKFVAIRSMRETRVQEEVILLMCQWRTGARELFAKGQHEKFSQVLSVLAEVCTLRSMGASGPDLAKAMTKGSNILQLELVPREDDGSKVEVTRGGPCYLLKKFEFTLTPLSSMRAAPPMNKSLLVTVETLSLPPDVENGHALLFIGSSEQNSALPFSEKVLVRPCGDDDEVTVEMVVFEGQLGQKDAVLVCQVYQKTTSRKREDLMKPLAMATLSHLERIGQSIHGKFHSVDDPGTETFLRGSTKNLWNNAKIKVHLDHWNEELRANMKIARNIHTSGIPDPGVIRNDLFLSVEEYQVEKGGRHKLDVTACVCDASGNIVNECFWQAIGMEPVTRFLFSNAWTEMVKLQLPMDEFPRCHILLECRAVKLEHRLYGFAFLPLMEEDGTVISDGRHRLPLYRCDAIPPGAAYLNKVGLQRRERLVLSVRLDSTKLTQNVHLMSLLNWKTDPSRLQETLRYLMLVDGDELVKSLQDVFDALFETFTTEEGDSTGHSGLVFQVIVHILSTLQKPKYKYYSSVIDAYIKEHFSAALVYKGLLTCLRHFTDHASANENQEPVQRCFKVIEYLMKFVVRSRLLFLRSAVCQTDATFQDSVRLLFDSFNRMLAQASRHLQETQSIFLHNVSKVYPHLLRIIPLEDVIEYISLLFLTVKCDRLQSAAVVAAQGIMVERVFDHPEARRRLLPLVCGILCHPLSDGIHLEVVGDLLISMHGRGDQVCQGEVKTLCDCLLVSLVEGISKAKKEASKRHLLCCLLSLLQLANEDQLKSTFEELHKPQHFILDLLVVFHNALVFPPFPSQWKAMRDVLYTTMLVALQVLAKTLLIYFREDANFDRQIWLSYFRLSATYVDSVKEQNMKKGMAFQVVTLWSHLGNLKGCFIPGMIGPFLSLTRINNIDTLKSCLPILADLMDHDFKARGSFKQVENELVDKLDMLVQEGKVDGSYKRMFMSSMNQVLSERDPSWLEDGQRFSASVEVLLGRLLLYRGSLQSGQRSQQLSCIVDLLNFYRNKRPELFLRYAYKLYDLQVDMNNFVEAALALKLHSDKLEWSTTTLHADLRYPSQKEWERKELLCLSRLDLLERGHCWEHAVPICKELARLYEEKLGHYDKLASILKREAKLFEQIWSSADLRPEPEYFRVVLNKEGGKEFIYRGLDFEKLPSFNQRIKTLLGEDVSLVAYVQPEVDDEGSECGTLGPIPHVVKRSLSRASVNKFRHDRPFHRGERDPNNDFKTLWVERITMEVSGFPCVLGWLPVLSSSTTLVPPLTLACEAVLAKTREFQLLTCSPSTTRLQALSLTLQGVLDAAINGGVVKYQEAFLLDDDGIAPDSANGKEEIRRLRRLLAEQLEVLESALELHHSLCSKEMLPLHRHLLCRWKVLSSSLRTRTGPLPPTPTSEEVKEINEAPAAEEDLYSAPTYEENKPLLPPRATVTKSASPPVAKDNLPYAARSSPPPVPPKSNRHSLATTSGRD